ncbi:hypothetical protein F4774DRAFT_273060 [Daldinia eschscholtzii]|nr:hypothetical protein F4774DRAFT_273060 [Daldinia eschscholtzii]
MVESKDQLQLSEGYGLVVDFIENDLPRRHSYFKTLPVRHHKQHIQYTNMKRGKTPEMTPPGPTMQSVPVPRPSTKPKENTPIAMTYWSMVFPAARLKFESMPQANAPKNRKPEYDIRSSTTWIDVYSKLNNARQYYTNKTGIRGGIRRVWEWTADNAAQPVLGATKLAPQMDIVTPVLAAVQIIIEAAQKGAEVRKEVLNAFDELEDVFSDVEFFLGPFRGEGLILDQAVSLVASVLLAIERGITFFTRPGLVRGFEAILKGKDYEKPLLDSLTTITSQSKKLMAQALKTHIRDFNGYSRASLQILESIRKGNREIAVKVVHIADKTDKVYDEVHILNSNISLLMDKHDEEMETLKRELSMQKGRISNQERLLVAGAREVEYLRNVVRSTSPYQPNSAWALPPRSPLLLPQTETQYIGQEELWTLLGIGDIDTIDIEAVEEKRQELPPQDRRRTEQLVHDRRFQDWIVSPASAKLMIYGNFSGFMVETSALSFFCTTLTKAFRSRKRYLCLVWFCGRHLGYDDESDSDSSDEEDDCDGGLNLGRDEEDDYGPETRQSVIKRMVRSLIAQLLCDYDFGSGHLLPPDIDPEIIEEGHSLSQLRRLFCWLVRQLPEEITLFCLIDGIVFYEREDFEDPMLDVLGDILGLTVSNDVLASVKVLVTSPRPTSIVRIGFEDEDVDPDGTGEKKTSILSMDLLTPSHMDISDERVNRNLEVIAGEKAGEEVKYDLAE